MKFPFLTKINFIFLTFVILKDAFQTSFRMPSIDFFSVRQDNSPFQSFFLGLLIGITSGKKRLIFCDEQEARINPLNIDHVYFVCANSCISFLPFFPPFRFLPAMFLNSYPCLICERKFFGKQVYCWRREAVQI